MGKSTLKMGFGLFEANLEHFYRLMGSRWKHLDQAASGPDILYSYRDISLFPRPVFYWTPLMIEVSEFVSDFWVIQTLNPVLKS